MEQAKLLSLTTVLTVLIWITADSLVNETVSVPVSFEVVPAGGAADRIVELAAEAGPFQLQISGPQKSVAQIQANTALSIRLEIPDFPTGPVPLLVEELLKDQWHEYPKVSILSVQPPQLPILVDRMLTREVGITLQRLTLAYDVKPQLRQTSVTARLRESHFRQMAREGQLPPLDISADVERLLKEQPVGQNVTVPVTLDTRLLGPSAVLTPGTVEVRATVTAQRTTAEIPTVPILLAASFANFEKSYRAALRDGRELVTQTIRVSGPTDAVRRLVRGETRAYGIVQLKDEHFSDPGVFKLLTPDFHLPPGIELAEKPVPVEFKLVDIAEDKAE